MEAQKQALSNDVLSKIFNSVYQPVAPKMYPAFQGTTVSPILKIFLKIILIHWRHKKCEENSSEEQFGFKNGSGAREALCTRCRGINEKLFPCSQIKGRYLTAYVTEG